ncbi:MAG: PrsW family intramembrane metalloprotease [Deltaproteobacteria bacterium]|nr:PrsW family intramembrane metalloprotease [Deltaproteobacteria bacterium]
MILAVTALAALVPSALLAWYFHSRDHRPEPARAVWGSFGLGVLAILPVLLVDWPIAAALEQLGPSPLTGTAEAFLVAAIPEEFFKFAVLFWYARRRRWFDEPMDGMVYGVIVSLGFATLENLLYSLQGGLGVALMRALLSVPGHAFWGAIMGYFVALAHFGPPSGRRRRIAQALFWPMLLHGVYDAPVLTLKHFAEGPTPSEEVQAILLSLLAVSVATIVVSAVVGVKMVRRMRFAQRVALARQGLLPATIPVPSPVPPRVAAIAAMWPAAAVATDDEPARTISLPPPASRPLAWVLLFLGGLLLVGGALMTAGLIAGLAGGSDLDAAGAAVGAVLFCALPLGVGFWLFRRGLRRLPRRTRATLPPPGLGPPPPEAPGPPRRVPDPTA